MTQDSPIVRTVHPSAAVNRANISQPTGSAGLTIFEFVLQTSQVQQLAVDVDKVQFRLCVDGQGRVCSQSGSYVHFQVDFKAKKPAEDKPAEDKPAEDKPVEENAA